MIVLRFVAAGATRLRGKCSLPQLARHRFYTPLDKQTVNLRWCHKLGRLPVKRLCSCVEGNVYISQLVSSNNAVEAKASATD